jgi:hypothetical protein
MWAKENHNRLHKSNDSALFIIDIVFIVHNFTKGRQPEINSTQGKRKKKKEEETYHQTDSDATTIKISSAVDSSSGGLSMLYSCSA